MLHELISAIGGEYSGETARGHVAKISGFHRIQASPGYRDAAHYVLNAVRRMGVHGEILSFPAREDLSWWSQVGFMEWDCEDAELVLLLHGQRRRLCSYREEKISLIQRSAPTGGRLETSVVYVENAADEGSYQGRHVEGKIVFSRGDVNSIARTAVEMFGAAGILVDNMAEFSPLRDRMHIPDARQYTSFWVSDARSFRAFGFVLSPRQGEELRRLFAGGVEELPCSVTVRSAFYEGAIEDVTAVIPGETAEEVVAIAHLCHPEPSANDNASGAGALIEAARALSLLICEGRLPRPRRTIRFLWVPEMTGSYMYLSANEPQIGKTVAAINLDMVGENQDLCKGPFLVERSPKALPGFGGDLAESILRAMTGEVTSLSGTSSYPLFKWAVTPFSGGSDHYIWTDPSVGITCPILSQWPDRFYHTSLDTIDKVDPAMLHLSGTLTAVYLYLAASASPADAAYLAGEMGAHFPAELREALQHAVRSTLEAVPEGRGVDRLLWAAKARRAVELRAAFLAKRKVLDLASLDRLSGPSAVLEEARDRAARFISAASGFEKSRFLSEVASLVGLSSAEDLPPAWDPTGEVESRAEEVIPQRAYRGPFAGAGHSRTPEQQASEDSFNRRHQRAMATAFLIEYWADGVRTAREIADCIEGETGSRDTEMILDYIELGAKLGIFL